MDVGGIRSLEVGWSPHEPFESAQRSEMAFAKTEREWAEHAARHLKVELKRAEVTYDELAERLKEHGFEETKASISIKLARATMSAHFFLASLAAIGREGVRLEEI